MCTILKFYLHLLVSHLLPVKPGLQIHLNIQACSFTHLIAFPLTHGFLNSQKSNLWYHGSERDLYRVSFFIKSSVHENKNRVNFSNTIKYLLAKVCAAKANTKSKAAIFIILLFLDLLKTEMLRLLGKKIMLLLITVFIL